MAALQIEEFNPEEDRIMICGSEEMTFEIKGIFEKLGSLEGSTKFKVALLLKKLLQKINLVMIKLVYFDFNFWRIDILRLSLGYSRFHMSIKE